MASEIRDFYFGEDGVVGNETMEDYMDMLSDVFFVYGIDKVTKMHAKKSTGKTFYYR